jgi:hypothetical protein
MRKDQSMLLMVERMMLPGQDEWSLNVLSAGYGVGICI